MAEMKYLNDAVTSLALPLSDVATSADVSSSAAFPVLGAGDWFWATLRRASDGAKENVRVTAVAGTTWTIEREAVAYAFSAGDGVYQRVNAELIDDLRRPDMRALGKFVAAGGTADVMTAALDYPARSLVDGLEVSIRAIGANTVTTPTLNLDGLGAKTITRIGGTALVVGDIAAANHELQLRYNLSADKWELLNPANTAFMRTVLDDATASAARSTLLASRESVATLAALEALTPLTDTNGSIYVRGRTTNLDGYEGPLIWDSADRSSEVAADSEQGEWVAPSSDATGASGAWRRDSAKVNIKHFGAAGDGVTDDTTAIQAAIDYASTHSKTLFCPAGTYIIYGSGNSISSREYGLLLKSNVKLLGEGMYSTIFKAGDNEAIDLINTDRTTSQTNIELRNLTLDGNDANLGAEFNAWLYDIEGLVIENLYSVDPGSWGVRIQACERVMVNNYRCDHTTSQETADGLHFKDTNYVVCENIDIFTNGDDGFIIDAENADAHDYSISNLLVSANVTSTAAGKGIYITNVEANGAAGVQRKLYNINIGNAVTYNNKGGAVVLQRGEFYNIKINNTDYGSDTGLNLIVGDTSGVGVTGYVKNSTFDIQSYEPDNQHLQTSIADGVIEYNTLNLLGHNPGDGFVGVDLEGTHWLANIKINYDPNGTKVSPSLGIDLGEGSDCKHNEIHVDIDGADKALYFRGTRATNNTIYINNLNSVTRDIDLLSGSDDNTFIGGSFSTINDGASGTKFVGVGGANGYGSVSDSTDGSANITIPHGLATTPSYANVNIRADTVNNVDVQTFNATNVVVRVKNSSGADVASAGPFTIDWEAKL